MTLSPEERVRHHVIAPEEVLESERGRLITGLVIARAWRDPDYLARLLAGPGDVLEVEITGTSLWGNNEYFATHLQQQRVFGARGGVGRVGGR